MRRKKYERTVTEIISVSGGESVCIATGSKGTGEALSKEDNIDDEHTGWDENDDYEFNWK
jgi:hypothetical protein